MFSEEQIRQIVEVHLNQTVKTGLINGGQTDLGINKIDPPKAMKWKGKPAWEIDFNYSTNITVTEGMTSSSREYSYRKTLVLDEQGNIIHSTKPKLEKDIHRPEFTLDL